MTLLSASELQMVLDELPQMNDFTGDYIRIPIREQPQTTPNYNQHPRNDSLRYIEFVKSPTGWLLNAICR